MSGVAMRMRKEGKSTNSAVRSASHSVRRENRTGIPTQLKERMERSTGLSLDDVRVHYNSALPARLDALAYTQGNQVEIGPGQERHLPHELGHVVQQKLGTVRANAMHSSGIALNTDARLERQADEIGAGKGVEIAQRMEDNVVQRAGGKGVTTSSSPAEEEKIDEFREKTRQWRYSPSDELYAKYRDVYQNPQYYDPDTGEIHWPEDDGFEPDTKQEEVIRKGTVFMRIGGNSGSFLGNIIDDFDSRSLAPHSDGAPEHYYELLEDLKMTKGKAAPWFGKGGGAEQFVVYKEDGTKYTIRELEDAGILLDITEMYRREN